MDALPAPVQVQLPAGERRARRNLGRQLRQSTEESTRQSLTAYLDLLNGLPAPLLAQLPGRRALEALLER